MSHYQEAEDLYVQLIDLSTTALDKGQIWSIRIKQYEQQGRWNDCVAASISLLELHGLSIPLPIDDDTMYEDLGKYAMLESKILLKNRTPKDLFHAHDDRPDTYADI